MTEVQLYTPKGYVSLAEVSIYAQALYLILPFQESELYSDTTLKEYSIFTLLYSWEDIGNRVYVRVTFNGHL